MITRLMKLRALWVGLLLVTAFLTWSFRHEPVSGNADRQVEMAAVGCSLWLPRHMAWRQERVMGGEILGQILMLFGDEQVGEIQRWSIHDIDHFLTQSRDLAYGSFLTYRQQSVQQNNAMGIRLSYRQASQQGKTVWGEEVWLWQKDSPERVRVVMRFTGPVEPPSEWLDQTKAILSSVKLLPTKIGS